MTDVSTITVEYTDSSDSPQVRTANVSGVAAQSSTANNGGGGAGAQPEDFSAILTAAVTLAGGALAAL